MPNNSAHRYSNTAIILHWILALAFIMMLSSGLLMHELPNQMRFTVIQLHKSLGVIVLLTMIIRVAVRSFNTPPALPNELSNRDKILAKMGHLGLYAAMIIMPLSGWVMVSSYSFNRPTMVFNLFEWPHIAGLAGNEAVNALSKTTHEITGYVLIGFISVHIAAVIKHMIIDRINLLPRMGIGRIHNLLRG